MTFEQQSGSEHYHESRHLPSNQERVKERELNDPAVVLEFVVDREDGTLTRKIWTRDVIDPSGTIYQLVRDEITGQLAIVKWMQDEIYKPKPSHGFEVEFNDEGPYRTSYGTFGSFEEVGLYDSRTSLLQSMNTVREAGEKFAPLAELQNMIDENIRREPEDPFSSPADSEDGDAYDGSMLSRVA